MTTQANKQVQERLIVYLFLYESKQKVRKLISLVKLGRKSTRYLLNYLLTFRPELLFFLFVFFLFVFCFCFFVVFFFFFFFFFFVLFVFLVFFL